MNRRLLFVSLFLFALFAFFTLAVLSADVQSAGPLNSPVGFASLNLAFHRLTGVHLSLYTLTDALSLVPLGVVLCFALLGLFQWIRRRSLLKVDRDILLLGGFYLAVFAFFLLFERFPVNFRPVLIDGAPEASYPSSTTLLVLCVMPTAVLQLQRRIPSPALRRFVCACLSVLALFMLAARLLSGVHWLTDILAGVLLSGALVTAYSACLAAR